MLDKINKILLYVSLLVSALTVGMFYYWYSYEKPPPSDAVETEKLLKGKEKSTDMFQVKKMVINIPSRPGRLRFFETSINFVPYLDTDVKILEDHEFILRDSIIEVARKMKEEELNSVSGKLLLEERLINQINSIFKRNIVKEIYFSAFVIQ
ncbi:MAG: flagellar basal body-associated protein FliL [Bacteriovoracales bacterium]